MMFLLMKKQGIRDMRHGKKEARDRKCITQQHHGELKLVNVFVV